MEGGVFNSESLFGGNMDNSLLTKDLSVFPNEDALGLIFEENAFNFPIEYHNDFRSSFDYFKINFLSTLNQSTIDESLKVENKDDTNLLLAIVSLMKQRQCPIEDSIIVNELKSKWQQFRKANGSKYSVYHFNNIIKD